MIDLKFPPDILSNWDVGPIHSIETLPVVNETAQAWNVAFVEANSGARYVLKRKTIYRIQLKEYRFLETLAALGIPVAVPIRARTGEPYVQVGDEFFDLFPRLAGTAYSEHYTPGGIGRARLFGQAIARLQLALRGCDQIVSLPDMDLPGDIQQCSPVVRSIWPADQRPPGQILGELEAGLANCFTMLPQQLIHGDAHPGNMLFQDGQLSGWIDFELMERGPRLFDLCYCSTALLMNGLDDPARLQAWPGLVRALVEGYESVTPLLAVERGSLRMMQMAIEVPIIAWLAHNNYPGPAARNILALVWLYENPYEL